MQKLRARNCTTNGSAKYVPGRQVVGSQLDHIFAYLKRLRIGGPVWRCTQQDQIVVEIHLADLDEKAGRATATGGHRGEQWRRADDQFNRFNGDDVELDAGFPQNLPTPMGKLVVDGADGIWTDGQVDGANTPGAASPPRA